MIFFSLRIFPPLEFTLFLYHSLSPKQIGSSPVLLAPSGAVGA